MSPSQRRVLSGAAAVLVLVIIAVVVVLVRGHGPHAAPAGGHASPGAAGSTSSVATTTTTKASGTSTTSTTAASTTTEVAVGPAGGPIPPGFLPQSITFVSPDQGFVLGTASCASAPCTAVLRTTDAARSWASIQAPKVPLGNPAKGGSSVDEMRFADAHDGWAFGATLWSTHDGGASWSAVSLPGSLAGDQVLALAASGGRVDAVVAPPAQSASGTAQLITTPASSDSWSAVPGVSVPGAYDASLVLQGGAGWLVVGRRGAAPQYFRTTGGSGLVCDQAPCGAGPTEPALAAADSTHLFAVCAGGVAAGQQPKAVLASSDAGASFAQVGAAPASGDLDGVTAASPSVVVVAAASGTSVLSRSTDGGHSWSTALDDSSSGGAPFHDLGFTTPSQGIVIEGAADVNGLTSRLLLSRDSGASWQPVSF
ncbi:MAG: WD40/YVTN/BNR-like repeat-containing protein [Acidimicrobiales bacterium]